MKPSKAIKEPKKPKIKDLHLRIPMEMWERTVKQADAEKRPPVMHAVLCYERGLGASK